MAEIIQPSGNILGGGTPTVGAVVFDKPQYDPVTLQMKVMGDLDEWQKERDVEAAKKRADIDKFALSLTVNPDGIHPSDSAEFEQKMNTLQDKVANVYRYQQGTPQFIAAKADAQKAQEEAKLFVAASKSQNKFLQALTNKFDPNKDDDEHFKEWFRKSSEANNPYDRQKVMNEAGLIPKKKTFFDVVGDEVEKFKPTLNKVVKSDGGIIKEISEENFMTPQQLDPTIDNSIPSSMYASSNEIRNGANEYIKRGYELQNQDPSTLTPEEKAQAELVKKYTEQAAAASVNGKTVLPQYFYISETAGLRGYTKKSEESKGETKAAEEAAKVGGGRAQAKNNAIGLAKFLSQTAVGDPEIYNQTTNANALGGWSGTFYGAKPFTAIQLGTFSKEGPKFDKDGNPIEGATETKDIPNFIQYFWWDNGKLRVATDQSIYEYKKGGKPDPFIPIDNVSVLVPSISMPIAGTKSADLMTGWTDAVRENKWGTGFGDVAINPYSVLGIVDDNKKAFENKRGLKYSQTIGVKEVPTAKYDVQNKTFYIQGGVTKPMIEQKPQTGANPNKEGTSQKSLSEKLKEGTKVKSLDEMLTTDEWYAKWNKLKSGQKMIGFDGKTYTKP